MNLSWVHSPSGHLPQHRAQHEQAYTSWSSLFTAAAGMLVLYVVWEQLSFWAYRRHAGTKLVPGPAYVVPLVGGLVEMVLDPFAFWEKQRNFSCPGVSYNSILGKFMLFVTDTELSRHVFNHNSSDTLLMAVHPSGKNILGAKNLAFMHGPPHKAIRKSFLSLFTRKALATYVEVQDGVIRRFLSGWLSSLNGEVEIRDYIRDLNATTSQEVFAGPYLAEAGPAVREKFNTSFMNMTKGFLAFPLCLPGTAVWRGKQGRLYILKVLEVAAGKAKAHMQAGGEPRCLMDFWAQRCLEETAEADAAGAVPPDHTSNAAMADTVMDFLFASQDASTASLVWMMCLMADHPGVLEKVREEQRRLRPDPETTISGPLLYEMTYTRQVVKETLRFRPPAPMVPMVAQRNFRLTDTYVAPKGSLIMPSITAALKQGFTNPETFDPDRFSPERKEDMKHGRNFLTFGFGSHYCVGKEYAINHLTATLAIMATGATWTRRRTAASDTWTYLPTVYPADSYITLQAGAPDEMAAAEGRRP